MSEVITIPEAESKMGSDQFYRDESPVRRVIVSEFRLMAAPVTVREFREFVNQTNHVTAAERTPTIEQYPDAIPERLVAGSAVFTPTAGPVSLDDPRQWWRWVPGATWEYPRGPGERVADPDHPVTHVDLQDALAYAEWVGGRLPTEAEWERAARAGSESEYAWGDELDPNGERLAKTFRGEFPYLNLGDKGELWTSAVRSYPPNPLGLYDMIGNVWEWCSDYYSPRGAGSESVIKPCCSAPRDPEITDKAGAYETHRPAAHPIPRRVVKGGSHLCHPSYCARYRPAARHPQAEDSTTSHIGFRVAF